MPAPALVLASASPRRASLLRAAGLEFSIRPVDIDESWTRGEHPLAYVERVAAAKAEACAAAGASGSAVSTTDDALEPGTLVLAADTTVWLDGASEPLAKPRDRDHARAMIRSLTRGKAHQVTTACVFARVPAPDAEPEASTMVALLSETTSVRMRTLSDAQFAAFIDDYLERAEWADKAGAYAIQGVAAALVTGITGSYTAVVGLPLAQVVAKLEELRS